MWQLSHDLEIGSDPLGMNDVPEEENEGQETSGHDVQKPEQEEKTGIRESVADVPTPYLIENARHDYTVGNRGMRVAAAMADKPVQRASLKEKLEAFKVRTAGAGKPEIGKAKGKEETL